MNKIVKTKKQYKEYNEELMRKANFTLQGKKRIQYNEFESTFNDCRRAEGFGSFHKEYRVAT